MVTTVRALAVLIVVAAAVAAGAAEAVPVVVAVDTSRSLTPGDLATIRSRLASTLEHLPANTPTGLIAFADQARWVVPFGASTSEVRRALDDLVPEGTTTVLHDALFIAVREMPAGGVVLIVTDGRDEGSATTVEDVARLAVTNRVPVVAASHGRRTDTRALKRLALLTDGAYVGQLAETDGVELAGIAAAVASAVEAAREPFEAPPLDQQTESAAVVVPTAVATPPAVSRSLPAWVFPAAFAVVVILAGVAFLVSRSRRRPRERACEQCGIALDPWDTSCPRCTVPADPDLAELARSQPIAPAAVEDATVLDPSVFQRAPLPDGLDRTVVLDRQPVLVHRDHGKVRRSYTLPRDRIFAVGRAPDVNTLKLEEPTVSAQHFKVVPKDDEFYVVDLETTNGTFVNQERVTVRRLAPGDMIRAGTVEFEFQVAMRRAN